MKLDITIEYSNGEAATYVAALPEWSKWERHTGKSVYGIKGIESFQQYDFLFLAHAGYVRANAGKPSKPFEIWESSVESVTVKEHEAPKVTQSEAQSARDGNWLSQLVSQ